MKRTIPIIIALACGGCLAKQLRAPVEDHYVQTRTIAERCKATECEPDLQEDLDAMAEQACALDAIVKGEDAKGCGGSK